eukprot:9180-Pelagomonas_calceolata.AAC.4
MCAQKCTPTYEPNQELKGSKGLEAMAHPPASHQSFCESLHAHCQEVIDSRNTKCGAVSIASAGNLFAGQCAIARAAN